MRPGLGGRLKRVSGCQGRLCPRRLLFGRLQIRRALNKTGILGAELAGVKYRAGGGQQEEDCRFRGGVAWRGVGWGGETCKSLQRKKVVLCPREGSIFRAPKLQGVRLEDAAGVGLEPGPLG